MLCCHPTASLHVGWLPLAAGAAAMPAPPRLGGFGDCGLVCDGNGGGFPAMGLRAVSFEEAGWGLTAVVLFAALQPLKSAESKDGECVCWATG